MARTKASVGAKVSSGKSSKARCSVSAPSNIGTSSGGSDKAGKMQSGGNPVCPRETPGWQKPITTFFFGKEARSGDEPEKATQRAQQTKRRNVIHSDDEEDDATAQPSNTTTLPSNKATQPSDTTDQPSDDELPLSAENNHTMDEYMKEKPDKGKGVGKKSNKENIHENSKKRDSSDLGLASPPGKKVKL